MSSYEYQPWDLHGLSRWEPCGLAPPFHHLQHLHLHLGSHFSLGVDIIEPESALSALPIEELVTMFKIWVQLALSSSPTHWHHQLLSFLGRTQQVTLVVQPRDLKALNRVLLASIYSKFQWRLWTCSWCLPYFLLILSTNSLLPSDLHDLHVTQDPLIFTAHAVSWYFVSLLLILLFSFWVHSFWQCSPQVGLPCELYFLPAECLVTMVRINIVSQLWNTKSISYGTHTSDPFHPKINYLSVSNQACDSYCLESFKHLSSLIAKPP